MMVLTVIVVAVFKTTTQLGLAYGKPLSLQSQHNKCLQGPAPVPLQAGQHAMQAPGLLTSLSGALQVLLSP